MLNLKPFRQKPALCGPASLKMVLDFYGVEMSEAELAKRCGSNLKEGTETRKIVSVAQALGMRAFSKDNSKLAELRKWVNEKGVPVIVDWFSVSDGHYSPVVAITEKTITLMDPELKRTRRMTIEAFMNVWFDFKKEDCKGLIRRRIIVVRR